MLLFYYQKSKGELMEKDEVRYRRLEKEEKKLNAKREDIEIKLAIINEEKDKIKADKVNVILKEECYVL